MKRWGPILIIAITMALGFYGGYLVVRDYNAQKIHDEAERAKQDREWAATPEPIGGSVLGSIKVNDASGQVKGKAFNGRNEPVRVWFLAYGKSRESYLWAVQELIPANRHTTLAFAQSPAFLYFRLVMPGAGQALDSPEVPRNPVILDEWPLPPKP